VFDGVVAASMRRSTSPTVYAIAGVLSLVLAATLWRRHSDEKSTGSKGRHFLKLAS